MSHRIGAPMEGEVACSFENKENWQAEPEFPVLKLKKEVVPIVQPVVVAPPKKKTRTRRTIERSPEDIKWMEETFGEVTELPFTMNALQVVARRYLVRDHDGKIQETPEGMFERVAKALAAVECHYYGKPPEDVAKIEEEMKEVLMNFEFTPAGRTIANAGGPTRVVSNCIVLHIEDSMDSIFQTLKDASMLQQCGSGLGFPMHLLRPAGDHCKRTFGVASGPVSFLDVYNSAFAVIQQQNRHGANMAVCRVDHPDILEFIHMKDKEGDIRNFNISVGLTDKFMDAVDRNDPNPWMCEFKGKQYVPRRILRGPNFRLEKLEEVPLTASQIFDEIIEGSWRTGEPGCVMIDTVNRTNPVPGLGRIESCNPCGEQFLHDGDVCNLGAINLDALVAVDEDGVHSMDYDRLAEVTRIAVRMLDNVVDITDFPVDKVNDTFRGNRRIGLGIMGFADVLYQLKQGYNTPEGLATAQKIMKCIQTAANQASRDLGEEKGVFPHHKLSVFAETGEMRRNAALTNVAPTGTISMMFDVSGGVEPFFALAYHYRGILGGHVNLTYINKHLKTALQERNLLTDEIMERIIKEGTLQNIDEIPDDIKRVFVTAIDISADDHIKMQASFQQYTDNAISKTINFPYTATREDIKEAYLKAWKMGCKGCTVYRDGSRQEQVLNLNDKKETKDKEAVEEIKEEKAEAKEAVHEKRPEPKFGNKEVTNCPDCDGKLMYEEGCCTCHSCGYSACSR